jgi:hypothetical protein
MKLVCVICDRAKPFAEAVATPSTCVDCGRVTGNRAVGEDTQFIAPGSIMTFREQREVYGRAR